MSCSIRKWKCLRYTFSKLTCLLKTIRKNSKVSNFLGEKTSLDELHPDLWDHLLKFCSLEDKKQLRLVNKAMYSTITDADRSFRHVYKKERISPAQIWQLADDFSTALVGLECTLQDLNGLGEAMRLSGYQV